MSKLTSLEFGDLDISGDNYLAWALDAEIHLDSKDLLETIKKGNQTQSKDKSKAMIFLHYHLHADLKNEYLSVKDPQIMWNDLKESYDHQKTVILPKTRYDWTHLRLHDFKSVSEYNSALFKITSKLELCGEKMTDADKLEKTFSTFNANNIVMQIQYHEKGFMKYSQLISCLLVAEKNNELLLKNHELRPTSSPPFPKVNVTFYDKSNDQGSGYTCGRGSGRGRGYFRGRGRGVQFKNSYSHQKWKNKDGNKQEISTFVNVCYRCGGKVHWSRTCCTPKYLVELYQQSVKQKEKKVESNLVYKEGEDDFSLGDITHMDLSDFLLDE